MVATSALSLQATPLTLRSTATTTDAFSGGATANDTIRRGCRTPVLAPFFTSPTHLLGAPRLHAHTRPFCTILSPAPTRPWNPSISLPNQHQVKIVEHSSSFLSFLTSVCAIVGGVFTVSGIVDAFVYTSTRLIKKKMELGKFS